MKVLSVSEYDITPIHQYEDLEKVQVFLETQEGLNASRLFLIENISSELIEVLGAQLDVDPSFFSRHLCEVDWYSRHSSPTTVPSSFITTRGQSFIHFPYLEARPVTGDGETESESAIKRLPRWESNIYRKITIMKLGSVRTRIGFARRHLTIWMIPLGDKNWTGASPFLIDTKA